MSVKIIEEENLDEIIKNMVKEIKKGRSYPLDELNKIIEEANENIEFVNTLETINLASPDSRTIYIDGNEQLIYDQGEFFLCDTMNSTKAKKKIKRKEATERYIEYFIRYQLNPIIKEKQLKNMSKTIKRIPVVKKEEKEITKKEIAKPLKEKINKTKEPEKEKNEEDFVR